MRDLLRRQFATQETMAKYRHREWSWKEGVTCVHMVRFHLRKMGHSPEPMPRVRSLVAAKRALKERGCETVIDLLDKQAGLSRIVPAQMLLGDLAAVESEDGLDALFVCAGPQKLIGWHDAAKGMVVVDVPFKDIKGTWRC